MMVRDAAERSIQKAINDTFNQILSGSQKRRLFALGFTTRGITPRGLLVETDDTAVMVGSPNPFRVHQFARLTGRNGDVLFIEPEPANASALRRAAEQYGHVNVDDRGVWHENGAQELIVAKPENPGDNKIPVENIEHDNDHRENNYQERIEIDVATLDSICGEYDLAPNYVEVMVNGAEMKVLKGATKTLSNVGPRLLIKGHARYRDSKNPLNRTLAAFIEDFEYETMIGASEGSAVGDSNDWDRRAGDVFGWKPS
jgi:FkbM family methyltransferase